MPLLFILFVVIPILEISLLIEVGSAIGGLNTIVLVILTASLGSYLVRQQGMATLRSAQEKLSRQQAPTEELTAGLCLFVAGIVLITPGFITDALGLALLIPTTRSYFIKFLSSRIQVQNAQFHADYRKGNDENVFEAEYVDKSSQPTVERDPVKLEKDQEKN